VHDSPIGVKDAIRRSKLVIPENQMLLAPDAPIQHPKDDLYSRAGLAERLARLCLMRASRDAIVIGLDGRWGVGKTSLLNLVEEKLERDSRAQQQPVVVVRFVPWLYATPQALARSLFRSLANAVSKHELDPKLGKRVGKLLRRLGELAGDLQGAAAVVGGFEPSTGLAISFGSAASSRLAIGMARRIDRTEDDLRALQEELAHTLTAFSERSSALRLVVLVDDFDRAAPTEISEFLKLTRLVLTIPNLTFVVAMDRSLVAAGVERANIAEDGDQFLEKFFQYIVAVPTIAATDLVRQVHDRVRAQLMYFNVNPEPIEEMFAEHSWLGERNVVGALKECIGGPRGVVLLCNAMLGRLVVCESPEKLHAGDLFALSALQVCFPQVYGEIARWPRKVVGGGHSLAGIMRPKEPEELRRARAIEFASVFAGVVESSESLVSRVLECRPGNRPQRYSPDPEEPCVALVRYLFPYAASGSSSEVSAEERVEQRICSRHHFPAYFAAAATLEARLGEVARAFAAGLSEREPRYGWELMEEVASDETASSLFLDGFADELSHRRTGGESALAPLVSETTWLERFKQLDPVSQSTHVRIVLAAFSQRLQHERIEDIENELELVMQALLEHVDFDVGLSVADDLRILKFRGIRVPDSVAKSAARSMIRRFEDSVGLLGSVVAARGFRAFSETFWRVHRLARVLERLDHDERFQPLSRVVSDMLSRPGSSIGHVLALVGGWGGDSDSSVSLEFKGFAQVRGDLSRILDLAAFDSALSQIRSPEDVDRVHSWRLVTQYRQMSDEDRASAQPG
jgi:Cdc6-like AAA superfamily ATPase